MKQIQHYSFRVIACVWWSLHHSCLSAATEELSSAPAHPANTAVLKHVQMKSSEARLTFNIQVKDASQPVVLMIEGANPAAELIASITPPLLTQPEPAVGLFTQLRTDVEEGVFGAPHQINLTFPQAGVYELSLVDVAAFDVKPQYQVIAKLNDQNVLETKIHVNLLVTVRKPFRYSLDNQAKIDFQQAGVEREIVISSLNLNGSTTYRDEIGTTVPQNLAYWVNDSDFSPSNKADAELQFPMKGNWPKRITLPGTIEFIYLGMRNLPITKEGEFTTTIAKASHILDRKLEITRESMPQLESDPFLTWPRINYINEFTYTPKENEIVYIRTNSRTPTLASEGLKRPATLLLTTLAGKESSSTFEIMSSILGKLVDQNSSLKDFNYVLARTLGELKRKEGQIDTLNTSHLALVQSPNASENDLIKSRAKLEDAKRAAADIVEKYNAAVLSYPD